MTRWARISAGLAAVALLSGCLSYAQTVEGRRWLAYLGRSSDETVCAASNSEKTLLRERTMRERAKGPESSGAFLTKLSMARTELRARLEPRFGKEMVDKMILRQRIDEGMPRDAVLCAWGKPATSVPLDGPWGHLLRDKYERPTGNIFVWYRKTDDDQLRVESYCGH